MLLVAQKLGLCGGAHATVAHRDMFVAVRCTLRNLSTLAV